MVGFILKLNLKAFCIHKCLNKNNAYTLAEMLIVLIIISLVLISIPLAVRKMFAVKDVKVNHGRYECYWDDSGKLKYYYSQERAGEDPLEKEGEITENDYCIFSPPSTYPYLMIHAVGGGGAGGTVPQLTGESISSTAYMDYHIGNQSQWPDWFNSFVKNVNKDNSLKTTYNLDQKDVYTVNVTTEQRTLQYRKSGIAGNVVSMFFPFIPNGKKFYLYPGKGGELKGTDENGGDGGNTVVQVYSEGETCDKTKKDLPCNIIFAKGGSGATVVDTDNNVMDLKLVALMNGGPLTDYGIGKYEDVKTRESGFTGVVDKINKLEAQSSKIPENAGNGGNGGNNYVSNTAGYITHEFDNFEGTIGRNQGVNWVYISQNVDEKIYDRKGYSICENRIVSRRTGYYWKKRSNTNGDISTTCYCDTVRELEEDNHYRNNHYCVCAVGYMKRPNGGVLTAYPECDNKSKGKCVLYYYKKRYNETEYSLLYTSDNNSGNYVSFYRSPTLVNPNETDNTKIIFSVEEKYNTYNTIYCKTQYTNEYTFNKNKPDEYTTPCSSGKIGDNGICPASAGGSGAIVILW